jgi:hypothetical protein
MESAFGASAVCGIVCCISNTRICCVCADVPSLSLFRSILQVGVRGETCLHLLPLFAALCNSNCYEQLGDVIRI